MRSQKGNPYKIEGTKKQKQRLNINKGLQVPENYEQFFVPAIGRPLAEILIRQSALKPREKVLDVACGTGIIARLAAKKVGETGTVTALDVNPGMLAVARSVTTADRSIKWYEASAEAMPLADEFFDVVFCQMGLQFMEDKVTALQEMRRVLKSGGRLLLNVPGPAGYLFQIFIEEMNKTVGPEAAGFVSHVFSLNDTSEIHQLMEQADFQEISVEAKDKTLRLPAGRKFLWQYVKSTPLFSVISKVSDEVHQTLECNVVKRWSDFEEKDTMKYQQRIVFAKGQR